MLELGKKLVASRTGRWILVCTGIGLALWAVQGGCLGSNDSGSSHGAEGNEDSPVTKDSTDTRNPLGSPPPINGFQDSLAGAGQFRVLVESYGDRVTKTEAELAASRAEIQGLKKDLAEARQSDRSESLRIDRILKDLTDSTSSSSASFSNPPSSPSDDPTGAKSSLRPGGAYDSNHALESDSSGPGLHILQFGKPEGKAPPQDDLNHPRAVHIPAGSIAQAIITNGVFAPTTGEPSPVRLFLQTDVRGPNNSRIPLGEAFLIGKASGVANSMRVTIEIDRMSLVTPNGKGHDARVLAYVVGHDGLEGVPGDYQWRAGELLPWAAGASGLTAAAEALSAAETVTSVSPLGGATEFLTGSAARYAGFQGVAGGSRKLEDMIVERMREIRPAISIKPYRQVSVVFLQSVTLDGIAPEELEREKSNANPFTDLDLHHR